MLSEFADSHCRGWLRRRSLGVIEGDKQVVIDGNCLFPILQMESDVVALPQAEVLQAGSCWLTALVHPLANGEFVARSLVCREGADAATPDNPVG